MTPIVLLMAALLTGCDRGGGTGSAGGSALPPTTRPTPGRPSAPPPGAASGADDQMALGNPDGATAQASARERYLVRRPQYALSYNDTLRFPNWVAWHLAASDVGTVERGQFKPDNTLPAGFTVITPSDYTGSGFDRGHNCPSKDRTATREDNDAVFLMSNMTPQTHAMNAGPWENLESYCRTLAAQGNELYIYCGHGFKGKYKKIGRAGVAVPQYGWKVVVVLPDQPGDDRARIGADTRVIAVEMPNVDGIDSEKWTRYVTTVADIERQTGLRFFDALPPAVADALRRKRDVGGTEAPGPRRGNAESKAPAPPAAGGGSGRVWVNLKSGAYWRPGTQYYGKTKEGTFMSEADALKAGYHAAGGQ